MSNPDLQRRVIREIVRLKEKGYQVVVVHGGGPFIGEQLRQAGIRSEFVEGHRKTTPEAMVHVEMALKGKVNGQLVSLFNKQKSLALGLSGKDAQLILATRRTHQITLENGETEEISLGEVGDVKEVRSDFLIGLLEQEITPVIACIGTDSEGNDYNINADMMAGHIAGALHVDHYLVLTDIDGLRKDPTDPDTHIPQLDIAKAESLFGSSIQGGMIPKIESCIIALQNGAHEAGIINGTRPELLLKKLIEGEHVGTTLTA